MTLEEGLVALLAAAAAILLFVGLAQVLDDRGAGSARRPRRRPSRWRTATAGPATPAKPALSPVLPPAVPPAGPPAGPEVPPQASYTGQERRRIRRPGSRPHPAPAIPPTAEDRTSQADLPLAPEATPGGAAAARSSATDPALDALERALTLQQVGQHAQVIEVPVPHLEVEEPVDGAGPSFARAALWAMVGVSRHALGDIEGAQGALEIAVRAAPDGVSEGSSERMAAAAASSARQLLAAADAMPPTSAERVAALRMGVRCLEWRIAAAPATEEESMLLDRAREALWDGYMLAGRGFMRRRQFAQAREVVGQALDSEDLPAARRAPLADLLALSVVRQIGRLIATARGTETSKADALDALERAREILVASSVEAITPGRWHAANRRIWNACTRLGHRDIEGFELEASLGPLFCALHLRDLDLELEQKTRVLLTRTIERISDGAGETIGRLLEEGDRDAAMQRWQDVREIIQKARDEGLSHEELTHAFGRVRQMLEQIEAAKG